MSSLVRKILTRIVLYLAEKYKTLSREMIRLKIAEGVLQGLDKARLGVLGLVLAIAFGSFIGIGLSVLVVSGLYQIVDLSTELSAAATLTWAGGISLLLGMIILLVATSERVVMFLFNTNGGSVADFVKQALKDAEKTTRKD
jgi:membrane-associated protease RseP (regulator of RpoE activity)